jgi:hypothetical protein
VLICIDENTKIDNKGVMNLRKTYIVLYNEALVTNQFTRINDKNIMNNIISEKRFFLTAKFPVKNQIKQQSTTNK